VLGGFYVAEDGRANPVDVTMALAKGAKQQGVRIFENTPVTGIMKHGKAVTGVTTEHGTIEAEIVVNCAGMWARQIGEQAGVSIPLQAAEHYYLITEPIDGMHQQLPVLEDPSSYGYFREEGAGLMIGLFEAVCAPWHVDKIPQSFSFGEIPPDWDRMAPYLERAMARVPVSIEAGVKKFFCGPESFTPDLLPIVGEAPELKNYFVAAGLNSIGILTGGGIGRLPLPGQIDADRPRSQAVAAAREAESRARLLQGRLRLGKPRLVRASGRRAGHREAELAAAELVRPVGEGAPGCPRGRHLDGHVVHVEVPGAGP
jgi:glycine/D-amino acid oxidase-like deaminating enzyme